MRTTVFLGYLSFLFQLKVLVLITWEELLTFINLYKAYRNCMGLNKTLVRLAKVPQKVKLENNILFDYENAKQKRLDEVVIVKSFLYHKILEPDFTCLP